MKTDRYCMHLDAVITLAGVASAGILDIYNSDFAVEHKDDRSPLTAADMAANHTIVAGLRDLTPEFPVLSEEEKEIPFSERSTWHTYWLVDPLDGTREFIKRNGEFTVNIALIENHVPVLGVVYVPVSGVCYFACKGQGAYRQDEQHRQMRIRARQWDGGTVTVAGSRSHRGHSLDTFLENLGDYEIIPMGSSLKSCLVAEGSADLYPRLGPTSEWDTAAAQCIVEEAGGRLTDTNMQPLRYNTKESLLNPYFFVFGDARHDWSKYLAGD